MTSYTYALNVINLWTLEFHKYEYKTLAMQLVYYKIAINNVKQYNVHFQLKNMLT